MRRVSKIFCKVKTVPFAELKKVIDVYGYEYHDEYDKVWYDVVDISRLLELKTVEFCQPVAFKSC